MIAKHQRMQSQTTYSQVLPVAGAVILLLNKALLACSSLKKKKKGRKDYSAGSGRTPGRPDTQASSTQGKRSKGLARLHFKTNTIKQAKISSLELTKVPTPRSP